MYTSGGFYQFLDNIETQPTLDSNINIMTNQYLKFIKEKTGLENVRLTQKTKDEIISDIGGLQMAELAFENWLNNSNLENSKLSGLEAFNPFQLFYITHSLPWCSLRFNDSIFLQHTVQDPGHHPLYEFRVKGPLSNSEKFAQTWNCPAKSPMNPQEKCQFW